MNHWLNSSFIDTQMPCSKYKELEKYFIKALEPCSLIFDFREVDGQIRIEINAGFINLYSEEIYDPGISHLAFMEALEMVDMAMEKIFIRLIRKKDKEAESQ